MENSEVRAVIKYLKMKKMTPTEIHTDLQNTLGESAPSYSAVKKWCREFGCGRASCEDGARSGRPVEVSTPENINKVHDLVMADRRRTIGYLEKVTGISSTRIQAILTEKLGLHKVSARWVPRMLTPDHKRMRVTCCEGLLARYRENPDGFLERFVTMDETWIHHFDPESKRQSMQWKHSTSPARKKFRVQPSAGKIMASVFWDAEGILFIDYLDHGVTITGDYYAQLIPKVREAIKDKRRGKLRRGVLFHQDNAPAHKSRVALAAIDAAGFELVDHPPYSPDLAPSDFFLFPKLKENIRGQIFPSDDDVMTAVKDWLEDQSPDFFLNGLQRLEHRWVKCIEVDGDYVEK